MSTSLEDVIRDAALKNRVGLREDDPIMVLVTIMNRIAEDQTKAQGAALEHHQVVYQEVALSWRKDATERSNQILNTALEASREAMGKGMADGAAKVIALVREESAVALALQKSELANMIKEFRRFTVAVTVAIGVGLTGAVVIALCSYLSSR